MTSGEDDGPLDEEDGACDKKVLTLHEGQGLEWVWRFREGWGVR